MRKDDVNQDGADDGAGRQNSVMDLSRRYGSVDKYVGCLLGGAVGDALGAPIEFTRELNNSKYLDLFAC